MTGGGATISVRALAALCCTLLVTTGRATSKATTTRRSSGGVNGRGLGNGGELGGLGSSGEWQPTLWCCPFAGRPRHLLVRAVSCISHDTDPTRNQQRSFAHTPDTNTRSARSARVIVRMCSTSRSTRIQAMLHRACCLRNRRQLGTSGVLSSGSAHGSCSRA